MHWRVQGKKDGILGGFVAKPGKKKGSRVLRKGITPTLTRPKPGKEKGEPPAGGHPSQVPAININAQGLASKPTQAAPGDCRPGGKFSYERGQ